jgi:predicted nucleic acid-binding protein
MTDVTKLSSVYIDSCVLIGIADGTLNYEPLRLLWEQIVNGKTILHISTLTAVEVRERHPEANQELRKAIRLILQNNKVQVTALDRRIASAAHDINCDSPSALSAADSIHIATALEAKVDLCLSDDEAVIAGATSRGLASCRSIDLVGPAQASLSLAVAT